MIRNYLTSILRYTSRNKAFTTINIAGLVIGMTACILITQFVVHEFSYDGFLDKKDRIFRVKQDRFEKGELSTQWAAGCAGVGPDLKANFAEVERYVRLLTHTALLSTGDRYFQEEHTVFASEDFFNIFSIPLIHGDDSTVLSKPFTIALSESMAKKYFGTENAIGKILRDKNEADYEVTGVFKDLPANSHMEIDALLSFSSFTTLINDPALTWDWDGFMTYILLTDKADANALEQKLPAFIDKKGGDDIKDYKASIAFHLQPVQSIHLDSDFMMEFKPNGNRQSVYFLSVVAILILIIAWINYINLSTAKSVERAREVGVRKVMGGFRNQLIQQYLFESLLLNTIAVAISIVLAFLLTPWFMRLSDRPVDYALFSHKEFWLAGLFLIMFGALLSGLYPAFVLSAFKPVEVLKGRFKNSGKGIAFRKAMVTAQFVASLVLMIGTFAVYKQISFMKDQELGVNIDQTLIIHSPGAVDSTYRDKFQVFKERIKQYPEVEAITASTSVPGSQPNWNAGGIRRLSQPEEDAKQYRVIMMDHDFIKLYELDVLAGRAFSGETTNEWKNVLLNEAACKLMGFTSIDEAINDQIFFWGDTFRIAGVLKNYHQESLKKAHEPLIFRYSDAPGGKYSIRFNASNVKSSIQHFEEEWSKVFPGNPFIHFFLDDHYNQQYKADAQFGKVFGIFSALAMFIASLGLFGLSSLSVIQRTKEIGVRKVLGASVTGILVLISRDYLLLIAIAVGIATPLSWYLMNEWLENFANRIPLSAILFLVPGILVTVIALVTVGFHTLKTASINPSQSLRYE